MHTDIEAKLVRANDLREQEKYLDSLCLYNESLFLALDAGDDESRVHALAGMALVYTIKHTLTGQNFYLSLYVHYSFLSYKSLSSAVPLALQAQITSQYADSLSETGDHKQAEILFREILSLRHLGIPEIGRYRGQYATMLYRSKRYTDAVISYEQSLSEIRQGDMTAMHIRVWETGVMMHLATVYKHLADPRYDTIISQAEQIIASHNLTIRKQQLDQLKSQK
jgi:tetratricopeptide (TPR) repeat protein